MLPVIIDASSDSMSPKMLFVTIVSNCGNKGNLAGRHNVTNSYVKEPGGVGQTCLGFLTSCIAALSTYMCESSMSGNSEARAITLFLQSMDAYSIIAAKMVVLII